MLTTISFISISLSLLESRSLPARASSRAKVRTEGRITGLRPTLYAVSSGFYETILPLEVAEFGLLDGSEAMWKLILPAGDRLHPRAGDPRGAFGALRGDGDLRGADHRQRAYPRIQACGRSSARRGEVMWLFSSGQHVKPDGRHGGLGVPLQPGPSVRALLARGGDDGVVVFVAVRIPRAAVA